LQALQPLSRKPFGYLGTASALHQNVEHVPILIDRPPRVMLFPTDADEDLVEMPLVARLGPATFQRIGEYRPKRSLHSRMVS
jgi:hypothetical protein